MLTLETPTRLQGTFNIKAPGFSPGVSVTRDLIPLRAAFGQDEANHDTARYSVDSGGMVWVPLEAVAPLAAVGGFVLPKSDPAAASAGTLKLHHNDAAGCSYHGRQYFGDANGDVLVPAEAASELLAHGFVPVSEQEHQLRGLERERVQVIDAIEG
jgi:hypothetical protein